jgi:hypothetical protein
MVTPEHQTKQATFLSADGCTKHKPMKPDLQLLTSDGRGQEKRCVVETLKVAGR